MDIDRNELLAAMYNNDEPEIKKTPQENTDGQFFSRTRTIKVGIITYEVPSVEYVQRLEMMVTRQAQLIEMQKRRLDRIEMALSSTRNFIRRQTGRIADMQMELEGKVDYREYP